MATPIDPEAISGWNRSDKLFLIRGMEQVPEQKRSPYLLPLVTDDDPVVRGKACIALETCSTKARLEAAELLFNTDSTETTILALELMSTLENHDFSNRLRSLINSEDSRVVKTCLDAVPSLPVPQALSIYDRVLNQYDPEMANSLGTSIRTLNHPDCLDVLKKWYRLDADNHGNEILRIGAGLPGNESTNWVKNRLNQQTVAPPIYNALTTVIELSP